MGGRHLHVGGFLRLWIESACQCLIRSGAEVCGDTTLTFRDRDQFFAIMASCPDVQALEGQAITASIAERAAAMLKTGTPQSAVVRAVLTSLPMNIHLPFSILQVLQGDQMYLVECDAPPLFLTRDGEWVLLPVVEEERHGHLIRECEFRVQDGDYIAMVSEGYICASGWDRHWGWRDIATSIRRLTDIHCDAEQLLGALVSSYHRLSHDRDVRDVSVIAMSVRPMRFATVWSGPPTDRSLDPVVLGKLMAPDWDDGPGQRVICGGTTAEIAARLLDAELKVEPRPEHGWREVPPVARLEGIDLVTEGLVTLRKARERMAKARRLRDLPYAQDGATRLAKVLLTADRIHFLVGLAVNPAQTVLDRDDAGRVPLRRPVIEGLIQDLKTRDKLVSVEYV